MIDLLSITNDCALAAQCDRLPGMRLFVDLERNGKAERQAGRNTFISTHQLADVGRIKAVLRLALLMVRVNPFEPAKAQAAEQEVEQVLAEGADMLMLPMFSDAAQLHGFLNIVKRRVPVVALLETAGALASLDEWIDSPGLTEVYVGLNDLHLSLGCRFMFEPLLQGHVDRVAAACAQRGLRFGFGGVARMDEGLLAGRDVLAEHLRLGSQAVILSRTFNRSFDRNDDSTAQESLSFESAVAELRQAEQQLLGRSAAQIELDRLRVAAIIRRLSAPTLAAV